MVQRRREARLENLKYHFLYCVRLWACYMDHRYCWRLFVNVVFW